LARNTVSLFIMLAAESNTVVPTTCGDVSMPLENGDRMHAQEFLRRYVNMPRVKKAEFDAAAVLAALA